MKDVMRSANLGNLPNTPDEGSGWNLWLQTEGSQELASDTTPSSAAL